MTPAYEGDPDDPKVVPRAQWYTAPASFGQRKAGDCSPLPHKDADKGAVVTVLGHKNTDVTQANPARPIVFLPTIRPRSGAPSDCLTLIAALESGTARPAALGRRRPSTSSRSRPIVAVRETETAVIRMAGSIWNLPDSRWKKIGHTQHSIIRHRKAPTDCIPDVRLPSAANDDSRGNDRTVPQRGAQPSIRVERAGALAHVCVFQAKANADSRANRTQFPRQTERSFHGKANADSTANRTHVPRVSER